MKQWQETAGIFCRLAEITAAGDAAAVACVVQISGSAYRRPGARFLIAPDGSTRGGVSGGCLEEDVRRFGLMSIEDGSCRLLHYETGADDDPLWGLGLGCNGEVDIFVGPTSRPGFAAALSDVRELLDGNDLFVMLTIVRNGRESGAALEGRIFHVPAGAEDVVIETGDRALDTALGAAARDALASGRSRVVEVDGVRAFVEVFEPPPQLVLVGAGDDAMPMAESAASVGFRVVVVDHRPAYLTPERFPSAHKLVRAQPEDPGDAIPAGADTFVVLKTHNLVRDKEWARRFVATPVPYIGLLGPRARCEEIAEAAGASAAGASTAGGQNDPARFFGPIGLDLGAEGPEQVGIAVVAELLAVRAGRSPGHLKNREAPIHDPES